MSAVVKSRTYGCVGDRWMVREDSFFDWASGMQTLANAAAAESDLKQASAGALFF